MSAIHDFSASSALAKTVDVPWESVYSDAFPGFHGMIEHASGWTWGQQAGFDRTVVLSSGAHLMIDEKVRYRDHGPDLLLEYLGDRDKGYLGWICKDMGCDFVAYAVAPAKVCYLLPFPLLRRAWVMNGEAWKQKYQIIETKNRTHTTVSVAVPIKVVMVALIEAMRVTWNERSLSL
jgi:hypothetical protein